MQRDSPEAEANHRSDALMSDSVTAHHVQVSSEFGFNALVAFTTSDEPSALYGENAGAYSGIEGCSVAGVGVLGIGVSVVKGVSSTPTSAAVIGSHTNDVPGVVGDGAGAASARVLGRISAADGGEVVLDMPPRSTSARPPEHRGRGAGQHDPGVSWPCRLEPADTACD